MRSRAWIDGFSSAQMTNSPGVSETLCTRLASVCESVSVVGVEGGEAFVPAGRRAFPVAFVVSDREVDELTGGFVVGEVTAEPDGFADDAVEAFDLIGGVHGPP